MTEHKRTPFIVLATSACLALLGSCAVTPLSNSSQMTASRSPLAEGESPSAQGSGQAANQSLQFENWNDLGQEEGRVEMAAHREVFLVATGTGLHLFDGEGCGQTIEGAFIRIQDPSLGCFKNRLFDPQTHQTCPVICRTLAAPSEFSPSPRTGALLANAGPQGQYLVVQTFNGFRMFERQLGCTEDIPLGSQVEFETSPEGCIATSIRPPGDQNGVGCGLWCR
jgi:hypothetical protein